MCGIAGIVASDALRPDDRQRVLRMRDVLEHRGPDEAGLFVDDQAVLGHRRLSIVDLAGGSQPLANEDNTIWVCFNGEIYNHAELRKELEQAGHVYRTKSDTETLVHAYEQWGDDCVDPPARHVRVRHLGRAQAPSAAGPRPPRREAALLGDGRRHELLFGSEIKSLLASGLVDGAAERGGAAATAQHAVSRGRSDDVRRHLDADARTHRCRLPGAAPLFAATGTSRCRDPHAARRAAARRTSTASASCSRSRSACG